MDGFLENDRAKKEEEDSDSSDNVKEEAEDSDEDSIDRQLERHRRIKKTNS